MTKKAAVKTEVIELFMECKWRTDMQYTGICIPMYLPMDISLYL